MTEKTLGTCYVTDEVTEISPWEANDNEENRQKFVTSVVAISRGKNKSLNFAKRYQQLMKEAAPNSLKECDKENPKKGIQGRPFEYVPVITDVEFVPEEDCWYILKENGYAVKCLKTEEFMNKVVHFSFLKKQDKNRYKLFTNLRTLMGVMDYQLVPYTKDEDRELMKSFKVIKFKAPHFVFDQIYTHTQLSKVAVSERWVVTDEYWLPQDIFERLEKAGMKGLVNQAERSIDKLVKIFLNEYTAQGVMDLLHNELGYTPEIYQRWSYGLKQKEWIMGAWDLPVTDITWEHLLIQRNAYPEYYQDKTQYETKEIVTVLKKIIRKEG